MTTRALMVTSAAVTGAAGIALLFAPGEVYQFAAGAPASPVVRVAFQLGAAALLGLGAVNWVGRGLILGGIYGRALVLGNLVHWTVGGLVMLRALFDRPGAPALWIVTAVYGVLAFLFAGVLRRHPGPAAAAAPLVVLLVSACSSGQPAPPASPSRYVFYLHGRIVEEQGRRPIDPAFGAYEYDAILDSLRRAGFTVLSEQRAPGIAIDTFVTRVTGQVDSLLRAGVPPEAITVIGFSRGGAIAILASSRLNNPALNYVFMAACGPWAFERPDIRVTGRLLSLYETSDTLGASCAPLFERRGAGSVVREVPIALGLGHGTFYQPRSEWLAPAIAWARGDAP
jgi:hypothetical protein